MRKRFEEQMERLHTGLIEMGAWCEQVIHGTVTVLACADEQAVAGIMKRDRAIDERQREIEDLCMNIILQQQPVAGDLRKVSAALGMITDMERIGDQAVDIAEIVRTSGNFKEMTGDADLSEMAAATMRMVTSSIDSFVKQDLELAQKVIEDDDIVDNLFMKVRGTLLYGRTESIRDRERMLDLLMIAKYYERIGDHATNIAEWVEYSITGRRVDPYD